MRIGQHPEDDGLPVGVLVFAFNQLGQLSGLEILEDVLALRYIQEIIILVGGNLHIGKTV